MQKLINGIVDFRQHSSPEKKDLFARLALGQRPDALFFACSDSRVAPNVFASTDPGDLFMVRNMGNIIPACDEYGRSISDRSEAASIEHAVANLGVTNIVVCGHSECGAMHALHNGLENLPWPNMRAWIASAQPALARARAGEAVNPGLSDVNRLSQLNVLEQVAHLRTYPFVAEGIAAGKISLHAWWFDIAAGEVLSFDPRTRQFRPVDKWVEDFSVSGPRTAT